MTHGPVFRREGVEAMQLTWVPGLRRFVGTQADARSAKQDFETIEVPVVKKDLIDYLNAVEERHAAEIEALKSETVQDDAGDDEIIAIPSDDDMPRLHEPVPRAAMIETIAHLGTKEIVPVLSAAIERMTEVAGSHGWAAFSKYVYAWTPAARSTEQGLGMLMLAAFDAMGVRNAVPEKKRAITNDASTSDSEE